VAAVYHHVRRRRLRFRELTAARLAAGLAAWLARVDIAAAGGARAGAEVPSDAAAAVVLRARAAAAAATAAGAAHIGAAAATTAASTAAYASALLDVREHLLVPEGLVAERADDTHCWV
jgi:hypothetical protein